MGCGGGEVNQIINDIWNDPVWSKVIATIIFAIFTQIFILIWGLINNLKFFDVYKSIINLFKRNNKITNSNKNKEKKLVISEVSTVFFNNRFCKAFPGFKDEYRIFNIRKEIHKRLRLFFEFPISFQESSGYRVSVQPIWWFNGHNALYIYHFEVINNNKILLNNDELIIEKIIVYRGRSYYEDFIYVECLPDTPSGLNEYDSKQIDEHFNKYGSCTEEFGIYKGKFITRLEFDDGYALINGKSVNVNGAKLRSRFLSRYNFIIAAKFSPYNCNEFDRDSKELFSKLLKNEIEFNEFISWMKHFPRNDNGE